MAVTNLGFHLLFCKRTGLGSWEPQHGIRLPILSGPMNESAGLLGNYAVRWSPYASMNSEMIASLDVLRDLEYGFRVEVQLDALILPLEEYPGFGPKQLRWCDTYDVTNEAWRTLLKQMGLPRPRVYELHPLSFSDLAGFQEAHQRLKEAEHQLHLGHFGESVGKSRIVVEAIFKHLGYKPGNFVQWKLVDEHLPEGISKLIKAFNNVVNPEHHATGTLPQWTRADARLVLHLALALAEYVGNLPVQPPPTP